MKQDQNHRIRLAGAALMAYATALWIEPAFAASELEPMQNLAQFVVDFLTGGFARSVAIIAVAVVGYLGLTGRLRWAVAGSVIIGIALVFGAAVIVDAIEDAVS